MSGLGVIDTPILMKVFIIGLPGFFAGVIWMIRAKPDLKPIKSHLGTFVAINFAYVFGQAFFPLATSRISLVATNVIVNLSTGITVLLAWLISREKISRSQKFGFLFALLGLLSVSVGLG